MEHERNVFVVFRGLVLNKNIQSTGYKCICKEGPHSNDKVFQFCTVTAEFTIAIYVKY